MREQVSGPVWGVSAGLGAVLTAGSVGYGYHRDELYYRMLPPAWGYVDQPPLTPFVARLTTQVSDTVWALRVPATLAAMAAVVVVALLARELGADRPRQTLAAGAYACATLPLMLGHLLLTSTLDLFFLPLLILLSLKAIRSPRWWVATGLVAGLTTYNRWLVAVVGVTAVLGLAVLGPRRVFASVWLWAGGLLALVVALPNLVYQATHDWPQIRMGQALAEDAGEVRVTVLILLVAGVGPLFPLLWRGVVTLAREPRTRYLVVVTVAVYAFTFVAGAQPHYVVVALVVWLTAGVITTSSPRRLWRVAAITGAVSAVLALPVIPVSVVGATPVTKVSSLMPDQVGWPTYVGQVARAYRAAVAADPGAPPPVIITANYGEAGAIDRFGPAHGLPRAYSGHNGLYDVARPSGPARSALLVGDLGPRQLALFAQCRQVGTLDNGVDVDNEEQDQPIRLCTGLRRSWELSWPAFAHLD